jgi:hypothetical protein
MAVEPVVFTLITRLGARAVPDPCSATTGLGRWNSATPPVANTLGFGRLAVTSTTGVPSPRIVCGFTAVALARPSPR